MMRAFISYRRGDKEARQQTFRIKESLQREFRFKDVFVDLSSIGVEKDFSKKIEKEIQAADFVILLIGPDWFDSFERREDDDRPDWVLFEVQTALADNKKIVPILLDGTECPDWTTARGLAPLAKVPAHPLSTGLDYGVHLEKIVAHMAKALSDERAK